MKMDKIAQREKRNEHVRIRNWNNFSLGFNHGLLCPARYIKAQGLVFNTFLFCIRTASFCLQIRVPDCMEIGEITWQL